MCVCGGCECATQKGQQLDFKKINCSVLFFTAEVLMLQN